MSYSFFTNNRQRGQAMAEFVVMTAGCLLLLFVLVPVVAKLSDMSYKAQEAARYTAWERTVWYKTNGSDEMLPSQIDLTNGYLASRSDEDVLNSAERRILGFTQTPELFTPQDIDTPNNADANRYWRWTHGNGDQSMSNPGAMAAGSTLANSKTPSLGYEVVDVYNSVMGGIASVVDIFGCFGQCDDDFLQIAHPIHNFYTTAVNIPVPMTGSQLGGQPLLGDRFTELNVGARSAVLADGWVAQTADGEGSHFDQKANDFVLGNFIAENPIVETLQTIIGFFEPSFKDLDLGYVNTDPIPDADVKCNVTSGFCYFSE